MVKNPPANAGDSGSIPGSGISPGGGNGNPPQYSCLGNPMDRGVWQAAQSKKYLKEIPERVNVLIKYSIHING